MAATTDSPSNIPVPSSEFSGDDAQHRLHRGPWSQIVRGDHDFVPPIPLSPSAQDSKGYSLNPASWTSSPTVLVSSTGRIPEDAGDGSPSTKKHVWNKLSNGSGSPEEVVTVMGAASWPALSESTGVPSKLTDWTKPLGDGSTGSQALIAPESPEMLYQNPNTNATENHVSPVRQKSMNRRNANANSCIGSSSTELPDSNCERIERSPKGSPHKIGSESGYRGPGFQGFGGSDHSRNSFKRGNAAHHRAVNLHNNNNGHRSNARDENRPNHDWNANRGGGRDLHHHQKVGPWNFIRQTASPQFMNLVQGYATPIPCSEIGPPFYYVPTPATDHIRVMPLIAQTQLPAVYFPAPDPQLCALLVQQIEYYFSGENLCKDIYLRQNMDKHGWVPISIIANFNRVRQLTNNIPFILDSMRLSPLVEIQGDKIRRRNDWSNWLLPPQSSSTSDAVSTSVSNLDDLVDCMSRVQLEESAQRTGPRILSFGDVHHTMLSRSASEGLTSQSSVASREMMERNLSLPAGVRSDQ